MRRSEPGRLHRKPPDSPPMARVQAHSGAIELVRALKVFRRRVWLCTADERRPAATGYSVCRPVVGASCPRERRDGTSDVRIWLDLPRLTGAVETDVVPKRSASCAPCRASAFMWVALCGAWALRGAERKRSGISSKTKRKVRTGRTNRPRNAKAQSGARELPPLAGQ